MSRFTASGLRNPLRQDRGELLCHRRDRIGRHKGCADMPHEHRNRTVPHSEQRIADQHRNAYFHIFPDKIAAAGAEIPDRVPDICFVFPEIKDDQRTFYQSGQQRSQCGAGDLHPGRSQFAENEHPVKKEIR